MEIKFRYVYKREETDEIIFEYFDIKDFDDWGINPEFYYSDCVLIDRNLFIGRKDINDQELFEGDILKDGAVIEWFDNLVWDSWGSPHSGFYCKKWLDENDGDLSFHDGFKDVEKVGNKYENPEFLK